MNIFVIERRKTSEMRDACKCTQDGDDAEKNG